MATPSTVQPLPPESVGQGAQSLLRTLRLGFFALRGVMALLLVAYLFSGFFYVKPNEEAFVLRFGKIVGEPGQQVIESGNLSWAWPKPIDRVVRVPVKESRRISSHFHWHTDQRASVLTPANQQANPGDGAGTIAPGTQGYLLTGDTNIVHAKWDLVYKISDPIAWYCHYQNPELVARKALESAVLQECSGSTIDTMFYRGDDFRQGVRRRLIKMVQEWQLGIVVEDVHFVDRSPPRFVMGAFAAVTQAEQEKSQRINEALGYRNQVLQEATGEKSRMVSEAEAYRSRITATIVGDAQRFEDILAKHREHGNAVLLSLYVDTLQQVLGSVETIYVVHQAGRGGQEIRLMLGPEARKPKNQEMDHGPNSH